MRRTVSDRCSSSSWNGGVADALRMSIVAASTSTSPDARFGIDGARGPRTHAPGDRDAVLVAQRSPPIANVVGAVGIAHDLHDALAVAQIDEDDAAVVAPPVHPAHDGHVLAEIAPVDAAAIIGAFQIVLRQSIGVPAASGTRAKPAGAGCGPRAISFGFRRASATRAAA